MSPSDTCPACGASLPGDARFCSSCGRPVEVPTAAPPSLPQTQLIPIVRPTPAPPAVPAAIPAIPPAPLPSEQVVSVIGMVTRKTGLFSSELYHMVISSKRLIFALQTKEMQMNDVNQARQEAKQQGKNFFGQIGAQMSTRTGEKYMGVAPESILAENPKNFSVDLSQVVKVSVFHGDSEDNSPDSMEIKTTSEKMKFIISNAYGVEKQLKQVLGAKVK
ncbi:MAG TPA: zinc ribbon domain-containing protein [Anaerolineaceae bacterium]|nr:zinc ribbon domain-containing protein [Anaerolineaceae bacterium]